MKLRTCLCLILLIMLCLTSCSGSGGADPQLSETGNTTQGTGSEGGKTPAAEQENPGTQPGTQPGIQPGTQPKPSTALDKEKNYRILFVGNSYTYYNDMPTAIFQKIAQAAGYAVEVEAITRGAYRLSQFANPEDTYGAKVQTALSGNKSYDFVILQEQSILPATEDVAQFYDAVRNLSWRIKEVGATPILYSSWGRKAGNSTLSSNGWTNESMTWKLAAAYGAIGAELNIPVAHAGLAFFDVYTHHSEINLYDADGSHPSYEGSYLAALTLFAEIFQMDPTEVLYRGEISVSHAEILRKAAKDAVFLTPSIPAEYQTTSQGKQA